MLPPEMGAVRHYCIDRRHAECRAVGGDLALPCVAMMAGLKVRTAIHLFEPVCTCRAEGTGPLAGWAAASWGCSSKCSPPGLADALIAEPMDKVAKAPLG